MQSRFGVDAASRDCYELLELTVDGRPQSFRRSARRTGQVYIVTLDEAAMSGEEVRIRQTFRVVTPASGHRIYVELPQPARDVSLVLDYTNTDIATMTVTDMVSSSRSPHVSHAPAATNGRVIHVDAPGWLLPKTGFAFTWTLQSELPREDSPREAA